MLLQRLGNKEDAEDVMQQVFIQAYTHIHSFRGECKFFTWLYTIALNRVRNHIRQKATRRFVPLEITDTEGNVTGTIGVDHSPTPDEEVASGHDMQALYSAIDTLKEDQRDIFVLHYFQHLPLEAVAKRLDKPLGTVKVYLHRARRAVQKVLTSVPA